MLKLHPDELVRLAPHAVEAAVDRTAPGRAGVRGVLQFARGMACGKPGTAQGGAWLVGVAQGLDGLSQGSSWLHDARTSGSPSSSLLLCGLRKFFLGVLEWPDRAHLGR